MSNDFNARYTDNGDIELYRIIPRERHERLKKASRNVYKLYINGLIKDKQAEYFKNDIDMYLKLNELFKGDER